MLSDRQLWNGLIVGVSYHNFPRKFIKRLYKSFINFVQGTEQTNWPVIFREAPFILFVSSLANFIWDG